MSHARSIQNRRAAINKLPPEILGHIFTDLVEFALPISRCPFEDGEVPFQPQPWTRVMLVCKRWREIALSTPVLWSVFQLSETPTDLTFQAKGTGNSYPFFALNRSGEVPLLVRLDVPDTYEWVSEQMIIPPILAEIRRIRELRLSLLLGDRSNLLVVQEIEGKAPLLDTLILHIGYDSDLLAEEDLMAYFEPLRCLFEPECSPNLRTVLVENYYGWSRWSMTSLQHLFIGNVDCDGDLFKRLFHVVAQNPTLESLVLYGVAIHTWEDDGMSKDPEPVNMPALKYVVITDCHMGVLFALNHWLRLPNDSVKQYLPHPPYVTWQIAFHRDDKFNAQVVHITDTKILGKSSQSAFCIQGGLCESFASFLRYHVPLHTVSTLTIAGADQIFSKPGVAEWILAEMPQLNKLALLGLPVWIKDVGATRALLPSLRVLQIHDAPASGNPFLIQFLRNRKAHGLPALKLVISVDALDVAAAEDVRRGAVAKDVQPELAYKVLTQRFLTPPAPFNLPKNFVGETPVEAFLNRDAWSRW